MVWFDEKPAGYGRLWSVSAYNSVWFGFSKKWSVIGSNQFRPPENGLNKSLVFTTDEIFRRKTVKHAHLEIRHIERKVVVDEDCTFTISIEWGYRL